MRLKSLRYLPIMAGLVAACSSVNVRTSLSPDADLGQLRSFHIMRLPERGRAQSNSPLAPMVQSSATSRVIRDAIREGLERRGYAAADASADFGVAYYTSARERLDVTQWDYGYPWRARWWRGWRGRPSETATVYDEGTVIVDVVKESSHDLIWRGIGKSPVSDQPEQYQKDIRKTVLAILDKFPAAPGH